jgi:hypothetical protein
LYIYNMLVKGFKNILVTVLAVVVLCSTLSFSVHKHFCGPFLKDISLIMPSNGCGMENSDVADFCSITLEKSCCNDLVELIKGQDHLKLSWNNFDLENQQFIAVLAPSYFFTIAKDSKEEPLFIPYSPPLVTHDIPVLHQSFLI